MVLLCRVRSHLQRYGYDVTTTSKLGSTLIESSR